MRTLTLVLVCLLLVSCAFALESGPSNKVGYVKFTCYGYTSGGNPVDAYQEFGLPFIFWDVPGNNVPTYGTVSNCPSDILGTQLTPGYLDDADQVVSQSGFAAYRDAGNLNVWAGDLEDYCLMNGGDAYWINNRRGYNIDIVLAGDAEPNGTGINTCYNYDPPVGGQAYSPYSWRDPRELTLDQLGLNPGFVNGSFRGGEWDYESDQIVQQGLSSSIAWYASGNDFFPAGWNGDVMTVVPGEAYWIMNAHNGNYWEYNFAPPGALMQAPTAKPASATIAKFKHSLVKKAPVKARATER